LNDPGSNDYVGTYAAGKNDDAKTAGGHNAAGNAAPTAYMVFPIIMPKL